MAVSRSSSFDGGAAFQRLGWMAAARSVRVALTNVDGDKITTMHALRRTDAALPKKTGAAKNAAAAALNGFIVI